MEFASGNIGRIPVKSWINEQEFYESDSLTSQAMACSSLPMAFHHFALMPDAHSGFGMPIGGVIALEGAISPAMVGYDIGCGMIAVKTDISIDVLQPIRVGINRIIRDKVSVGEGGENDGISKELRTRLEELGGWDWTFPTDIVPNEKISNKVFSQVGTLGGGNHFIEFDYDDDGYVWVVIHSGSRGVGHGVATHYMKAAEKLNAKWWAPIPKELACLPIESDEGQQYKRSLEFSLNWALINRETMMLKVMDIMAQVYGSVSLLETINVNHNDANLEHHFGRDVWIHRKGATRARKGDKLVIPGNMGQGTAICTGKGNLDSFTSSSHGAGRRMGRKEAKRTLDAEECKAHLDSLDVVLSAGRDGAIDEMPEAYKDLVEVMAAQDDLVEVNHMLTPTSVLKG